MIKILFICHGNICRSPMAEFVLKDMVKKLHREQEFFIASAATSTEEIGNPVHPGTREKLRIYGISTAGKYAVQKTRKDNAAYDYLLGMPEAIRMEKSSVFWTFLPLPVTSLTRGIPATLMSPMTILQKAARLFCSTCLKRNCNGIGPRSITLTLRGPMYRFTLSFFSYPACLFPALFSSF